jgi:succinate dehydrogenase / fumarate reductase cytochrome b subunit
MTKRPVFLQLTKIHFPVAAIVSILHRVSGVLLSLLIPVFIYLFGLSLRDQQGFSKVLDLLNSAPGKLITVFLVWMLSHHFFAGLRFLLIDLDVGLLKTTAARSAWLVHASALIVAAITLGLVLL